MTLLPIDFIPGENDVLLGRGKDIFAHNANKRFRIMIQETMVAYDIAPTKADKTSIIREIVNRIKEMSPNGGFVAFNNINGRYYKVVDKKAHEKTSQAFRDLWYSVRKKRSATKLTRRRKQEVKHTWGGTFPSFCEFHHASPCSEEPSTAIKTDCDSPFSDHFASISPNYNLSGAGYSEALGNPGALSPRSSRSYHSKSCDSGNGVDNLFRESGLQDDMSAILRYCCNENENFQPEQTRTRTSPTFDWTLPRRSTIDCQTNNFDLRISDGKAINSQGENSADDGDQIKNQQRFTCLEWEMLVLFTERSNEGKPRDPVPF